ncbi:uncharacterized protein LOC131153914 [Malania oleifera]|uniref:uncharacterized protein LOC131153914 n=1 Tax=Malania oleifera TaxID=397392 RepID=UPI0025ADD699|nr:uncharacterized protein LOC131153914 [Malania oleifera]
MKEEEREVQAEAGAESASSTTSYESEEAEELQRLVQAPPFWKSKKRLSKQLSMCETPRDIAWERRRRQILRQERRRNGIDGEDVLITDEDLHELKGCIELGFGFCEEEGQKLCNTLPALDLYFAVHRQLSSPSPVSTPHSCSGGSSTSLGGRSSSFGSPMSDSDWKICSPGDNPQRVKTKLRHWAQAVACSVMQSQ